MAKKRKNNPNRFKKMDNGHLFSFDPVRREVFKWGLIAGLSGGLFMLQQKLVWQIIGIFAVVFISNHRVNKAANRIPRWHATILSFIGAAIALFGVIISGTIIFAYLGLNNGV